jgi:predicted TIM-barrel fold metal-dependent hydrolase
MNTLPFQIIDADTHMYEPDDCFTRNITAAYADRVLRVRRNADGSGRWFAGDKPLVYLTETIDRTLPPGSLHEHFRMGVVPTAEDLIDVTIPEYREPAARLKLLDQQNVQAAVMYHGVGLLVDHELRDDVGAIHANLESYNRWIEDTWTYDYRGRIFTPALLSMREPEVAVRELDRVIAGGARIVVLRPGPVDGVSPSDRRFDPFWARLNEANVIVSYHVTQAGYTHWYAKAWGEDPDISDQTLKPFTIFTCFSSRPIQDTILKISLDDLFGRFPNLRVMAVEQGAEWLKPLGKIERLINLKHGTRASLRDDSGDFIKRSLQETLREHLWVVPFPEEDPAEAIEYLGIDHVLYGSDYPHPEGMAAPEEYAGMFAFSDADLKKIMRGNAAELLGISP